MFVLCKLCAVFSHTSVKNDVCVCCSVLPKCSRVKVTGGTWCAMSVAMPFSLFFSFFSAAHCNSVLTRKTICATFPAVSCFCTILLSRAQPLVAAGRMFSVSWRCQKMAGTRYTCQISSLVYALYLVMRLCRKGAFLCNLGIYASYLLVLSFELYLCRLAGISYHKQKVHTFLAESSIVWQFFCVCARVWFYEKMCGWASAVETILGGRKGQGWLTIQALSYLWAIVTGPLVLPSAKFVVCCK